MQWSISQEKQAKNDKTDKRLMFYSPLLTLHHRQHQQLILVQQPDQEPHPIQNSGYNECNLAEHIHQTTIPI